MYVNDADLPAFGFRDRGEQAANAARPALRTSPPIIPKIPSIHDPQIVRYARRGVNPQAARDLRGQQTLSPTPGAPKRRATRAGKIRGIARGMQGLGQDDSGYEQPLLTSAPIEETVLQPVGPTPSEVIAAAAAAKPGGSAWQMTPAIASLISTAAGAVRQVTAPRVSAPTRVATAPVAPAGPSADFEEIGRFLQAHDLPGGLPNWVVIAFAGTVVLTAAAKGGRGKK